LPIVVARFVTGDPCGLASVVVVVFDMLNPFKR